MLLLAVAGWGGLRALRGPTVATVAARRGPLVQRVVLTGRVMSAGSVQLGTVTLGTVQDVLVDSGSHVQGGQLLLRLADAEQRAAVAQEMAGLALAKAQLGQVRQVSDRVAVASLQDAQVAVAQAERELQRSESLASSGAISPQAVEAVRDTLTSARTRQAAAQARATGARGSEAQLAGARIAEAQVALELAKARLALTTLLAPAAGVIVERHTEPGDIVQPGKVLLVLARDGGLRLEAQTDEKNLTFLKTGLSAEAVADGVPGQPFPVHLSWISPAVDLDRGNIAVRFAVSAATSWLKPDMTVSINVEIARKQGAPLLPLAAVRDATTERPWVLVVRDGGTLRAAVTVGSRGTDEIEILGGVDGQTDVVVQTGIAEGSKARPNRRE